jgi:adenylate cyclase
MTSGRAAEDALFDWLVDGAPGATDSAAITERLGGGLVSAGVPLDRVMVFVTTLHPTVLGRAFRWKRNAPVSVGELTAAIQASPTFKNSPFVEVTRTKQPLRRRLERELEPSDYPVLHDLRKEGFTDYLAEPLAFTSGELHVVTFATRAPGGFDDRHVASIRRVLRPLARVAEIFALRRVAANLLSTYVGRDCGDRILAGRILRGDVETLRAVIWFSDLRGFTEMSSRLPPREIVGVLNQLFDCQVPAIESHGGEVLKFIGDGLLAIFPFDDDGDLAARCKAALEASRDAFAALDDLNSRRSASGGARASEPIRFGLALHAGEIAYGNIGGASRLDFTAIGPAVNVASRLEGLTSKLGRRLVLSPEVAAHAGAPLDDLGSFDLKGVPHPQRVFAPTAP